MKEKKLLIVLSNKKAKRFASLGLFLENKIKHRDLLLTIESVSETQLLANHGTNLLAHLKSFDLVVQKFSPVLARKLLRSADAALAKFLNTALVEPLDKTLLLNNRSAIYRNLPRTGYNGFSVRAPRFESVSKDLSLSALVQLADRISFPMICKPSVASGTADAHLFFVLFRPEHLEEFHLSFCGNEDSPSHNPAIRLLFADDDNYVLQKFYNHGGKVLKVYVLGARIAVFTRNSLPDLHTQSFDQPVFFQNAFKHDFFFSVEKSSRGSADVLPEHKEVCFFVAHELAKRLGIKLFGFDVIVRRNSFYILDVNYFPTYKEFDDLQQAMLDYFLS